MAKPLQPKTIEATGEERTWRLEIFTEKGEDPTIRAHREIVYVEGDKVISRDRDIPVVERRLSQVTKKTVGNVTGMQLAGLIAAWADDLREEDIEATKQEVQDGEVAQG